MTYRLSETTIGKSMAMKHLASVFLALTSLLFGIDVNASETTASADGAIGNKVDRTPKLHGVFRGRYEGTWPDFRQRFQVRNARVSLEGEILENLDYYFRVDLCDCGSIKFLDAWGRWKFNSEFDVKAGRFRVPFGVDAFRGPGGYIFADRSFIGKQMANLRQVGIQARYRCRSFPLTLEGGVFNSSTSQTQWQKDLDYAVKASYRIGNVTLSASFLSMMPADVRMNLADGSVSWQYSNLIVEGEYQRLHYCANDRKDVNAWLAFASYGIPVNWKPFNLWSFHGRFDAMGDHSDGIPGDDGLLIVNDPSRRRVTVGTSISCLVKKVKAEIILDYEKYFFDRGVIAPVGQDNKVVAELVLKF